MDSSLLFYTNRTISDGRLWNIVLNTPSLKTHRIQNVVTGYLLGDRIFIAMCNTIFAGNPK
jgi:hypothetical protein